VIKVAVAVLFIFSAHWVMKGKSIIGVAGRRELPPNDNTN